MQPGDIVFWNDPVFTRHRFFEIEGVFHGGERTESMVKLRFLTRPGVPMCGDDNAAPTCLVPEVLIRGHIFTRANPHD